MRLRASGINKFQPASYSALPLQNTCKMAKRFAPEVIRNRITTNWVVASAQEATFSPVRRPSFTRSAKQPLAFAIVLAITGCASLIGFQSNGSLSQPGAAISGVSKSLRSSSSGPHESDSKKSGDPVNCTDLISRTMNPSDLKNPRLSIISSVDLGGTIFEKIACDSASSGGATFQATWVRSGDRWRLSEVSRSVDRETH